MLDILNLALPFFGLIFIGFACGKWRKLPDEGLAWMNFFILYVALPALFFRILSKTPVVHPVLVLVLLAHFGTFSETWVNTAVLMAALPPALSAYVFARQYDSWIAQASSVVLHGTLASVATLTAVMWLVKAHALPQLLSVIMQAWK